MAVLLIRILIVLVICRCVNATEATMETARLVKEDRREVNAIVGCKTEGKSTADTLCGCLSLLTLAAVYTPVHTNVESYFCRGRRCQHGSYRLIIRCAGDEKTG